MQTVSVRSPTGEVTSTLPLRKAARKHTACLLKLTLPFAAAVFTAPIRPDVVALVHSQYSP